MTAHYKAPGWFTRNVFNRPSPSSPATASACSGRGCSPSRAARAASGARCPSTCSSSTATATWCRPAGEGQWVRNLRAAGTGELRVGKRTEAFRGRELDETEKVPVLRAYLKRWKMEVGVFFDGVGPDSTDEQLAAISPRHPAFEVLPAG